MTQTEKEVLLRQYAAGEVTWTSVRGRGIDSYSEVLAGLGELGLRPPMAPFTAISMAVRTLSRSAILWPAPKW